MKIEPPKPSVFAASNQTVFAANQPASAFGGYKMQHVSQQEQGPEPES